MFRNETRTSPWRIGGVSWADDVVIRSSAAAPPTLTAAAVRRRRGSVTSGGGRRATRDRIHSAAAPKRPYAITSAAGELRRTGITAAGAAANVRATHSTKPSSGSLTALNGAA